EMERQSLSRCTIKFNPRRTIANQSLEIDSRHGNSHSTSSHLEEGVEDRLKAEKKAALTDEEREVLEMKPLDRSIEQSQLARAAQSKMEVTPAELAEATDPSSREEATQLAKQLMEAQAQVRTIDRYRDIVNFLYWKKRCEAEQLPITVAARKLVREADELFAEAYVDDAKIKYEQAWDKWDEVYKDYDILIDDVEGEITYEAVMRYKKLLGQLDIDFPPPEFKLKRLLEEYGGLTTPTTSATDSDEEGAAPEGTKSLEVNESSNPPEPKETDEAGEDTDGDSADEATSADAAPETSPAEAESTTESADTSEAEPADSGTTAEPDGDAEAAGTTAEPETGDASTDGSSEADGI
ncbi:MAG: hypothetical protein AAF497_27675, partial [Planctomycetota bacterium]